MTSKESEGNAVPYHKQEKIRSLKCGEEGVISQFGDPSVAVNPPVAAWPPADAASLGMISEKLLYFMSSL